MSWNESVDQSYGVSLGLALASLFGCDQSFTGKTGVSINLRVLGQEFHLVLFQVVRVSP